MKVLSLFDGISCAQLAMKRAGKRIDRYYASEIDREAIAITQKHFPSTLQLGDVSSIDFSYIDADIIFGGFPCQDLSINKYNREGLKGKRSGLFYHLLDALDIIQPKYFFIENVASMSDSDKNNISKEIGIKPIEINSAWISAQQRKRLYWTNIPCPAFNIYNNKVVNDILETETPMIRKKYKIPTEFVPCKPTGNQYETIRIGNVRQLNGKLTNSQYVRVYSVNGKSVSLGANGGGWGANTGLYLIDDYVRKLTPLECERLQTLPDNYTKGFPDTSRYRMIGNGWTVDVVTEFLKKL